MRKIRATDVAAWAFLIGARAHVYVASVRRLSSTSMNLPYARMFLSSSQLYPATLSHLTFSCLDDPTRNHGRRFRQPPPRLAAQVSIIFESSHMRVRVIAR